jgi:hypothetical protein
MGPQPDAQVEISRRGSIATGRPLAGQPNALAVSDSGRDVDVEAAAVERQAPPAAGECIFQRQL